jgi:hypothetical protein
MVNGAFDNHSALAKLRNANPESFYYWTVVQDVLGTGEQMMPDFQLGNSGFYLFRKPLSYAAAGYLFHMSGKYSRAPLC